MRAISFFLCFLFLVPGFAQQTIWSGRTEITGNLNLPYKLECAISIQSRFTQDFNQFGGMFYYLEPSWELPYSIKLETEYRHRILNGQHQKRFRFGVSRKWKISRFSLSARMHAQLAYRYLDPEWSDLYPMQNRIRPRLLASYKINKSWSVDCSSEAFLEWQNHTLELKRMRYRMQVNRDVGKKQELSMSFFYQPVNGNSFRTEDFVVLMNYSFRLGKIKKVKKKTTLPDAK